MLFEKNKQTKRSRIWRQSKKAEMSWELRRFQEGFKTHSKEFKGDSGWKTLHHGAKDLVR